MKKKTLYLLLGGLALMEILVVGSKSGWFGKKGDFETVEVATIETINITETVSATGKIQPEVEVNLSSEVSGEIIELPVKEGQSVEKGDLLVKINPDLIQSALNQGEYDGIKNKVRKEIKIWSPYSENISKSDLIKKGYRVLGNEIFKTWSCYLSGNMQCGKCESCNNRKIAFAKAKIEDKTKYLK